ncbi:hypothetical protein [Pontibacillus salipaludis]|uniref:Uncharacterized protein n=1 Tax=Pontibacillus salipaludis TaxID=1697394 RepID=A0ABQ1PWI1_9BACI|nr:hypothetical protein [Pontibacillus salipaludis]GGD05138.1 hypothetical protein GCM10011389_10790 [Pontibacillus salipaludis]
MKYPEPTSEQKRAIVQFFKRVSLDRVLKQKQEEKKNKENSENVV